MARSTWRRLRRLLLFSLATGALALVGTEVALRLLLFGDSPVLARAGRGLRRAGRWADPRRDPLFWKLNYYWAHPDRRRARANFPDPLLGWRSRDIEPETYVHRGLAALGARRPLLLYGDSFAQGVGDREDRYEALFEGLPEAREFALLNYGVGGYGFDQIWLLLRESIDAYADRDPVVVIGLLMDDDLDRTMFDFRGWPKPRVHLEGDRLVVEPPPTLDADEYMRRFPPTVRSWLWRFLLHSPAFLDEERRARLRGEAEALARKKAVNRAILADAWEQVRRRGLPGFVLLFTSFGATRAKGPHGWEEPFLLETLRELEIPYVITRPDLLRYADEHGLALEDLFLKRGPWKGHYSRAGNEATLRTIQRGLRHEFDPYRFVTYRP